MTDELHLCRKIVEVQDGHEYVTYEPVNSYVEPQPPEDAFQDERARNALAWVKHQAKALNPDVDDTWEVAYMTRVIAHALTRTNGDCDIRDGAYKALDHLASRGLIEQGVPHVSDINVVDISKSIENKRITTVPADILRQVVDALETPDSMADADMMFGLSEFDTWPYETVQAIARTALRVTGQRNKNAIAALQPYLKG